MFGINGGEFLVLLVVVAIVVGPQRLPQYAEQLASLVKSLRGQLGSFKDEFSAAGSTDSDIDWSQLDPRKYDPRRIVREALTEPAQERSPAGEMGHEPRTAVRTAGGLLGPGELPPWDVDAT
ncbi:Sec-independent protein translocase TatB [Rarobacter incanus]|uniref:Sec-independent protein translocase protein TatB n=1 Tax=Rarobacter incanus TaxID=153494 RepID=A0A542SPD1_9MICO|nr:Sec-independent protein translocase TatB [Rarobacter incanus]TQK76107.1 sec-independent protein translocase protein TatB [Rarobacter incanus]